MNISAIENFSVVGIRRKRDFVKIVKYAAIRPIKISIYRKSHHEEVAAFEDPRANGDSTLNPAYRDAFPLRELQASQPTGDG
ncbi:hypothetical protein V1478_006645 [Vespula squamosa]|uniref:Uncharacterized protein n=1 Tax=Vespula squamosa TaxID=30214 RepID=A0ABD2B8F1_VESSQ